MKALTPNDQLFLWLERRNQPMHVGGLILLKPTEGQPLTDVGKVVSRMRSFDKAVAPFNQRLHSRMGMWFWAEDDDFDLDAHFFHLSLPKPGRIRELLELVSKLHASQMDRAKPLWEAYMIDGLEDGRAALYVKVHHALVDGVACMKMLQRSMADSTSENELPPFWANENLRGHSRRSDQAEGLVTLVGQAMDSVKTQLLSLPKVLKELGRSIYQTSVADPDFVSVIQAPRSVINRRITASRRFAAQSWSMQRIKDCAANLDMTLNDVVLAMCGSALRQYLAELQALPARPLVAM
ncbi:MAG: wax ester/triacylglycerol synthase family O-acyltransferase, partial [Limnobacter sp.]|nr:wax ester/triacylglycerol synthase family O-acyltransferase [Limnobacter sp.]